MAAGDHILCMAGELEIDDVRGKFKVGDVIVEKGEKISIDGSTGEVLLGEVKTVLPKVAGGVWEVETTWEYQGLEILVN